MASTSFEAVGISGGDDGHPIIVTATTSGSPDTIHVATSTANQTDEVYLWAQNIGTTEGTIFLQGDDSSTKVLMSKYTSGPNRSVIRLMDGHRVNDGVELQAYISSGSVWVIYGNVNRITSQ